MYMRPSVHMCVSFQVCANVQICAMGVGALMAACAHEHECEGLCKCAGLHKCTNLCECGCVNMCVPNCPLKTMKIGTTWAATWQKMSSAPFSDQPASAFFRSIFSPKTNDGNRKCRINFRRRDQPHPVSPDSGKWSTPIGIVHHIFQSRLVARARMASADLVSIH